MFARLKHDIPAVFFPKEWSLELKQILLNIYGEKCIKDDKTFEVYGLSYPNEVLLMISYSGLDKFQIPITFFVSSDLSEKTDSKKVMNTMFDSAGVFFDSYFAKQEDTDEIWDEYVLDWEEMDYANNKLFYKVTRENIELSMEANLLLGDFIED